MDLCISEAHLQLQPSLAVNPISVYPNMMHTPLWLHTSVGGFHPSCRWPGCKIRDVWPKINVVILLFLNCEAAVKASLQMIKNIAELRAKSIYTYIRHAHKCTARRLYLNRKWEQTTVFNDSLSTQTKMAANVKTLIAFKTEWIYNNDNEM